MYQKLDEGKIILGENNSWGNYPRDNYSQK